MHNLLAFYAGPDQIMTVTSGLASVVGVLLVFWHKLVAAFGKLANKFRRRAPSTLAAVPQKDHTSHNS
ncbi:MAG TPA: hypothetical protein VGU90_18445 [Terriglobales bacterium]|nr:hypothetical protein [Terriglobales bacterium]